MYGLIAKLVAHPGRRDELVALLRESAANMPGCLSYVVASDAKDEDTLWVTELWDSRVSHETCVRLPQVQNVVSRARATLACFERVAETTPVWASPGTAMIK